MQSISVTVTEPVKGRPRKYATLEEARLANIEKTKARQNTQHYREYQREYQRKRREEQAADKLILSHLLKQHSVTTG